MSYEICKSVKVFKTDDGKWTIEAVGHCNNVYPHTDHKMSSSCRWDSKEEAEGAMIYDSFEGMLQGSNRYSWYAKELMYGVIHSKWYERYETLGWLHQKLFTWALDYDPHFTKTEGVEKDVAKAERCRKIDAEVYARRKAMCVELAREMAKWKPDRRRYNITIEKCGQRHYVSNVGKNTYRYFVQAGYRHGAKVFGRIKAEECIKGIFKDANARIDEVAA